VVGIAALTASCSCNPAYYGSGYTCTLITPTMILDVAVTVSQTNVNSTYAGSVQNRFTANLAALLSFPATQIAYDHAQQLPNGDAILFFAFYPDPVLGTVANQQVNHLESLVGSDSSSLSGLGFTVVDMSAGGATVCTGGCSGSSGASKAWIAGPVVGGLAAIAVIAFVYKRRSDNSSGASPSKKSYASSNEGVPSSSASAVYRSPAAAPVATTTSQPYFSWTTHRDEQGHIYYFNHENGESRWEKPAGVPVAPLGA